LILAICESINNNAAKLRICVGFNKQSMNELLKNEHRV